MTPRTVVYLVLGGLAIWACTSIYGCVSDSGRKFEAEKQARQAAEEAKPPEVKEAERRKKAEEMAGNLRAIAGAKALLAAAHDPKALTWDSVWVVTGTNAVCYAFRAINGFGARRKSEAVLSRDGKTLKSERDSGYAQLHNKECAGQTAGNERVEMIRSLNTN